MDLGHQFPFWAVAEPGGCLGVADRQLQKFLLWKIISELGIESIKRCGTEEERDIHFFLVNTQQKPQSWQVKKCHLGLRDSDFSRTFEWHTV